MGSDPLLPGRAGPAAKSVSSVVRIEPPYPSSGLERPVDIPIKRLLNPKWYAQRAGCKLAIRRIFSHGLGCGPRPASRA